MFDDSFDPDLLDLLHEDRDSYNGSFNPPIYRSSTFGQDDLDAIAKQQPVRPPHYIYTRVANPTTHVFESLVAKLEHAEAGQAFSSGMGAVSCAILTFVGHGDHILCVNSVYSPARAFLNELSGRMALTVEYFTPEQSVDLTPLMRPNTKLIYCESPTTFKFEVLDLPAISRVARAHGAITVIDNTWATPLYQKPLDLGIDVSLHSATKYLNGSSDVVAGVLVSSEALMTRIRPIAQLLGATLSPEDAYLIIRGMRTLPIRMAHHQQSGLRVAEWLQAHPLVVEVRHPGLPTSPYHDLAKAQMTGFSSLFSVVLKPAREGACDAFAKSLRYFGIAPSWGGFESLIVPVAVSPGEPAIFRLAVGLEPVEALIGDLDGALACYGEYCRN